MTVFASATQPPVAVIVSDPPAQLLLFSGIVVGNNDPLFIVTSSAIQHETLDLNLNFPTGRIIASTSTVALASIGSSEGVAFTFATDTSTIAQDPNTGSLSLIAELSLQSETPTWGGWYPSMWINRVSYSAQVLVEIEQPIIAGTLRWSERDVAAESWPALSVSANSVNWSPPGGFGGFTPGPVVATGVVEPPVLASGVNTATYLITGVPFGQQVTVLVTALPSFKLLHGNTLGFYRSGNTANPLTLTPTQSQQQNVDFVASVSTLS
ncbi:hypothetical protein [Paraburkholderia humisilvae]|uniref:Uncharacterized protein n=1 Tax=Paraburkholderia humisilvae TaxID=627669 RepID=A0A6J5ES02_9BURK|nr:hypothetical protein [Paraburkholderia humisilvae]CAB3769310.1 hypothetical protein LMG29542_06086 [Paraburkholderia humisilvae]